MSAMSWQLPHTPLLGRVVTAQTLGLAATIGLALTLAAALPLTGAYPGKAAVIFAAVAFVVVGYIGGYHPFPQFGPANIVTTMRAALVSLTAALLGEPHLSSVAWAAAVLGGVATALDGVDGWLARRSSMASRFGARYDMELDALLILVLALIAWRHGKAGPWIVLAGAMRYLFVGAGYLWQWLDAPLPPSSRRQTVCVVQLLGLGIVVSPFVATPASVGIAAATLAALTWSFGVDVLWLRRHGV
jgi:phosphatidylglycerophosphate synthase